MKESILSRVFGIETEKRIQVAETAVVDSKKNASGQFDLPLMWVWCRYGDGYPSAGIVSLPVRKSRSTNIVRSSLFARTLRIVVTLLLLFLVGIGDAWGDTKTDVMFAKGFGGYTTNSFSAAGTDRSAVANSTDATGVTYAMQVFNGSTGAVRGNQSTASANFSCRNTTTYDDYYISQISLSVTGSGTYNLDGSTSGRSVVYFGNSAYVNPTTAPTGNPTASNENTTAKTLTWTNTDESVSYFILYNLKTSGTCLSTNATYSLKITWTEKTSIGYTIAAQSNNNSYGTVSLSGTTITASPKTGYRVRTTNPYTISPANSATVSQSGNTFTVTPSANTTITIYFEAIPAYTVTLKDDNTALTESYGGAGVTLPSRTGCAGYTFAGWTKTWTSEQSSWTTTAPTIIPAGSYTPSADENLYPVYTKTGEGGDGFKLSLTYNNTEYYIAPRSGSNKYLGATTSDSNAQIFYIEDDEYLYIYENSTKTYISSKSNNTDLTFSTTNPTGWTISNTNNGWTFESKGTGGRELAWNYNNGNPRFSSYTGSNSYLYHFTKHSAGVTYYTSVSHCEDVYKYTGQENNWGETMMSLSSGGTYYYYQTSRDDHQFKIKKGSDYYGDNFVENGFAMTNITLYDYQGGGCDDCNCYCTYNSGTYYIIVFIENTSMNSSNDPVICASTTLPDDSYSGLATTKTIYFKPSTNWKNDNAKYAINGFGHNNDYWSEYMTQTECDDDVWQTEIPALYSDIIIVRLNPSGAKDWSGKWNQTANLRIPIGKNMFSMPVGYEGDGAYETWSIYSPSIIEVSDECDNPHTVAEALGFFDKMNCLSGTAIAVHGKISYIEEISTQHGNATYYISDNGTRTNELYIYRGKYIDGVNFTEGDEIEVGDDVTIIGNMLYYHDETKELASGNYICLMSGIFVTGITVKPSTSIPQGMTEALVPTITPANATNKNVTWESSNPSVATVGPDGVVTAVSIGTANITVKTEDGNHTATCVVTVTSPPNIDVVEWDLNAVFVEIENFNAVSAQLENEGTVVHYAQKVFFSKYFEAKGNVKLLGIYNGTDDEVDISNYQLGTSQTGAFTYHYFNEFILDDGDDSPIDDDLLTIQPGKEIIFISYNSSDESVIQCASANEQESHFSTYIRIKTPKLLFNGDDAVSLLDENGTLIDIIGAGDINEKNTTHVTAKGEYSFMDDNGWTASGKNYETHESNYIISTNRCLLIRNNTVESGLNAVASNEEDFVTLGSEWSGLQIPKSADDQGLNASCHGFEKVGSYDYNSYYSSLSCDDFPSKIQPDGTYKIVIDGLSDLACSNLKIVVNDDNSNELSEDFKIPIMVSGDKTTLNYTSEDLSANDCKTCDVIVLGEASLESVTNGKNEVRDIHIYPGGTLKVTSNFKVNQLIMCSKEDAIPAADITGTLTRTNTTLLFDKRISSDRWYFFALPYSCAINTIKFHNGTNATHGSDFLIKYYDGAARATANSGTAMASQNWKSMANDATLQAGVGYILAIDGGHPSRELRFPMAATQIKPSNDVTVQVTAHGMSGGQISEGKKPNNVGWNLVGNPYLNYYTKNSLPGGTGAVLQTGELVHDGDPWTGAWVNNGNGVKYVVAAVNGGYDEYQQKAVADTDMEPFMGYFVQVASGTSLLFDNAKLGKSSIVARHRVEEEEAEDNSPVWVAINMTDEQNKQDETTLLISNLFNDNYEVGDDLGKMRGSGYKNVSKPVLASRNLDGEMAFNALPDSSAKAGVPLNYYAAAQGNYTISLSQKYPLTDVSEVWLHDAVEDMWTNLLLGNYQFTSAKGDNTTRFTLSVTVKRQPQVETEVEELADFKDLRIVSGHQSLAVLGVPTGSDLWVYDAAGKLVVTGSGLQVTDRFAVDVPASGVYNVRVVHGNNAKTLQAIVR